MNANILLQGFVSENPTAPIQLSRRRAPPCLNEFCRLGCVCPGLSYCSRISHCGRPTCMFGCSCLKQKVVLLKNLDGSDSSSSSHQGNNKKKKKRRRMKMAYGESLMLFRHLTKTAVRKIKRSWRHVSVLKEADSVSQPAERVRTMWKRDHGCSDPEPVYAPEAAPETRPAVRMLLNTESRTLKGCLANLYAIMFRLIICFQNVREDHGSCARVRGYSRKIQKWKVSRVSLMFT